MSTRVTLEGATVLMVDEKGETHRAGQLMLQKDGTVLFETDGAEWIFSSEDLVEIAAEADRYQAFAAQWKP